jgi:trigger factor
VLGEGRMLKDFEAQLTGMSPVRNEVLRSALPGRLSGQGGRGKTAQFEVTSRKWPQPHLPDVDAEFAKAPGVADGDLARCARR